MFKHVLKGATSNVDLLLGLVIDERLEHRVSSSEDEGTINDVHLMHDLRVVVLSH